MQYQTALADLKEMVVEIEGPPKSIDFCGTAKTMELHLVNKFEKEGKEPKLFKDGPPEVARFKVWVEPEGKTPGLFPEVRIPEGMIGVVTRAKLTTYSNAGDPTSPNWIPYEALVLNTIWWGPMFDCPKGLKQAIGELVESFFGEYRTANPRTQLPSS